MVTGQTNESGLAALTADAERLSLVTIQGGRLVDYIHSVMENAADSQQSRGSQPVKEKMSGFTHNALGCASPVAAEPEVICPYGIPDVWSRQTSNAFWIGSDIAKRCNKKELVPKARNAAKLLISMRKYFDDVLFCCCRQPICPHRLFTRTLGPLRCAPTKG